MNIIDRIKPLIGFCLFASAVGTTLNSEPAERSPMQNTTYTVSYVDAQTIQLRFVLGDVVDAEQTTVLPDDAGENGDWIWRDGWVGRVGDDGQVFMPIDTYASSDIDDLFDAPETGAGREAKVDDTDRWTITVNGSEVALDSLSRKSHLLETATVGWGEYEFSTIQNVFLRLDAPLEEGDALRIGFDDADFDTIAATYAPATTVSEAIHVNLAGFDPDDLQKVAYLSSWNGFERDPAAQDGGTAVAQVYDAPLPYQVINAATGAVVLTGETTLATPATQTTNFSLNYAQTDVWEMDLAGLTQTGDYYITVDGVGRSHTFAVQNDHWNDVFETAFSGFYHQRSGIALTEEFTAWTHPRSLHPDDGLVTVYASTTALMDTDEGYDKGLPDQFGPLVAGATDEIVDGAWGGWHDAGDWDRRTQHMEAARKLIELVEVAPDWAEAQSGNIPESGDGIPDLLNEAAWGLGVFARMQTEAGGIRGGIEGDDYREYGAASWTEAHTLYAYAPDVWSSWEFAASAAKLAKAMTPYDAREAAYWLEKAEAAMAWAEDRIPDDMDVTLQTSRNLAAVELYGATGDEAYHAVFLETTVRDVPDANVVWNGSQWEAAFVYARLDPDTVDADVAANGQAALQARAEFLIKNGMDGGFGFIADPYAAYGWGNTASQPMNAAHFMLTMHALTGDDRYLKAAQSDVQYALGANPLNMAYLTGIDGAREPQEFLNADNDAKGGGDLPSGMVLYGDYNIFDYEQGWFHDVMWNDLYPNPYQTPINESFQGFWGFVPSTEYTVQQGMTDMTYVTGYMAALNSAVAIEEWTTVTQPLPPHEIQLNEGTSADDRIHGTPTADLIRGGLGDDFLEGAKGSDILRGGGGDDSLKGGRGFDVLIGGTGDDALFGEGGNDWLDGGHGDDFMRGGTGADVFVIREGRDVARDFEAGIDTIAFDPALWDGTLTAQEVVDQFATVNADSTRITFDFGDGNTLLVRADGDVLDITTLADDLALV